MSGRLSAAHIVVWTIVTTLVCCAAWYSSSNHTTDRRLSDRSLPHIAITDIDGRSSNGLTWRAEFTLVNFWATWCTPCREEIPALVSLQARYRGTLQVVGIADANDSTDALIDFRARYDMNYPIIKNNAEIASRFPDVGALPTSYVVGPKGVVLLRFVGALSAAVADLMVQAVLTSPTSELLVPPELASSVPGLDLTGAEFRVVREFLLFAARDACPCGCRMSTFECRLFDSKCARSRDQSHSWFQRRQTGVGKVVN